MLPRPTSRLALAAAVLAVPVVSSAATVTWTGAVNGTWDTVVGNWSGGSPDASKFVSGDSATFGSATNRTITVDAGGLSVGALTFASTINGPYAFSGGTITLTGGLTNSNTVASQNVTIGNNIVVSGTQTFSASNANGVTVLTGNLSGTIGSNISITGNDSSGGTLPSIRLGGSNSGFAGDILMSSASTHGVLLQNPSAMIGGNINISTGNTSLWIDGSAGTYTFGIGTGAGAINFRNAGTGGLAITGGDAVWDPGNGSNYTWANSGNNEVRLNGRSSTSANSMLYFGNSSSALILSGANKVISNGNAPNGQNTTMRFALSDDGTARNFSSSSGLMILTRQVDARGGLANLGGSTTISGGALAISNLNQIFNGNLNINGGVLLLDGISWSAFTGARTAGTGSGQFQFNSGGFAARNSAITIDSSQTTASTFDKNFTIGSGVRDASGNLYANAGVTIARDTTLTATRTITVANNGAGFASDTQVVNAISGNLSGAGAVLITSVTGNSTLPGELVLSGANSWTGSPSSTVNTGVVMNAGPGGLVVARGLVRFDGNASLPTGNGGNNAYIAAALRNDSTPYGILLTGTGAGSTYQLGTGYKFVIATTASGAAASTGVLGASGGKATLNGSTVYYNGDTTSAAFTSNLLVRSGAEFTLGSTGSPVRLVPTFGFTATTGTAATTVSDVTTATRTLVKRGEGTLALTNLAYTNLAASGDTASLFTWQIGRGSGGNSGAGSYFDGAVRVLANNDPAANNSNSLKNFFALMRGGVLEIDNSGGGSGTFNATVGTSTAGRVSLGNTSGTTAIGGGGFAAYGGNVVVDLNTLGTRDTFTWGGSSTGFVQTGDSLLLGSQTANAAVEFYDNIALNGAQREIRVIDNAASSSDLATISGLLSGTTLSGINKTGSGVLRLSNNNTYAGATTVSAGKLLVNGAHSGTGAVTVAASAVLGGSGSLAGATTVNGSVQPGNSIGTLTIANDVTWNAGDAWLFELGTPAVSLATAASGGSTQDQLNLTGGTSDFLKGTGSSFTFDFAGTGAAGWYKLVDWAGTTSFAYTDFVATNLGVGMSATFTIDNASSALYVNVVVPEPTSLGLLAFGAMGLMRRRR